MLRRTPLSRKTRLKSRSPRKAEANARYEKAKAAHFALHPNCEHPDGCSRSILNGHQMDLHHRAGRNGPLLYCSKYFATACRRHHNMAKDGPIASRANGWIVDVSQEEVRRIKLAELGIYT